MTDEFDLLILGLGNVLFGDDGLGVVAVQSFGQCYDVPGGVSLADGGTLGLALLPLLQQSRGLLVIDAIRCPDAEPGSFIRLEGAEVASAVRDRLSPHQVGVADLLDAARLLDGNPKFVRLLGLVPETMEWAVGRSQAVRDNIGALVEAIVREVQDLGHAVVCREEMAGGRRSDRDLAHHFGM